MTYEYKCDKCETVFSKEFPFGKAKEYVVCSSCKTKGYRYYSFSTSIPDPVHESREGRGKG